MARKQERIDTSGGEGLSQDNPFAALSGEGLKAGSPLPAKSDSSRDALPPTRPTLLLRRLKAGRGGKVVTEISGFRPRDPDLPGLLKQLQRRLGTGGTCKGDLLELQGEWRSALKPVLEDMGFRVRGI